MHRLILLLFCGVSVLASERENLLKSLSSKYEKALVAFQKSKGTQIEMTSAAGKLWIITEPLLAEAAEWKLCNSKMLVQHKETLNDVYRTGREIEAVFMAPREEIGSAESMLRFVEASRIVMRQVRIFLLSESENQRWHRIADSTGKINDKKIKLKNGHALFIDTPYADEVELNAEITPEFCFSDDEKDYAILSINKPKAVNSDFLRLYLCRFNKGNIVSAMELDTFCLEKIIIENGILHMEGQKTHQREKYTMDIRLKEVP